MSWTANEVNAAKLLIPLALAEDLDPGSSGWGRHADATSEALIPDSLQGKAAFVARAPCILAGAPLIPLVFSAINPAVQVSIVAEEGRPLAAGDLIASVSGPMKSLLLGERTALNFLQRLSGIATWTSQHVQEIRDLPVCLLDTRKSTPGWRRLEKYAVRMGGATNHRMSLADGILIKDNHLACLDLKDRASPAQAAKGAHQARAWAQAHGNLTVEIEVDGLDQLAAVLSERPDIILLDNFVPDQMREAVALRNRMAPSVKLEASGGIGLANLREIALTGVDRISMGGLIHQARSVDIALDYLGSDHPVAGNPSSLPQRN